MSVREIHEHCPTCGPTKTEPHPSEPGVTRCANCKEWLTKTVVEIGVDWFMVGPHPTRVTGQFSTFSTAMYEDEADCVRHAQSLVGRSHVWNAKILRRVVTATLWRGYTPVSPGADA